MISANLYFYCNTSTTPPQANTPPRPICTIPEWVVEGSSERELNLKKVGYQTDV